MANRFWVGGTGTWDSGSAAHWALTSGAGGGQTVPGGSDVVTFDGASGGGTVTVAMDVSVQSITCGAFTGTLDWATNNNNVAVASSTGVSISGSGTRTINLGNGTWTFTAAANWSAATTTNLTFAANSSTLLFTGATARQFTGGGLTYSSVTVSTLTAGAAFTVTGANTFANLTFNGPCNILLPSSTTQTVTNAFTWTGTPTGPVSIAPSTDTTAGTFSCTSGTCRMNWCALRRMTYSGGATFSAVNSFDLGGNTGPTIVPPRGPRPSFRLGI